MAILIKDQTDSKRETGTPVMPHEDASNQCQQHLTPLDLDLAMLDWTERRSRTVATGHLSDARLRALAVEGGWQQATDDERAHLAGCPICLDRLLGRLTELPQQEASIQHLPQRPAAAPTFIDYGLLEAAASPSGPQPLRSPSRGGHFVLNLLPKTGDPPNGLALLEAVDNLAKSLEGHTLEVRDSTGRVLIAGPLRNGRIAAQIEDITRLDLTAGWTLIGAGDDRAPDLPPDPDARQGPQDQPPADKSTPGPET